MEKPCTIALDAMGGDYAPAAVIEGAKLANDESNGRFNIILVGDSEQITAADPRLAERGITVIHTSQVISMCDSPLNSLRDKKDSSIVKIVGMLREQKVDAIFSAGNTGAFMAASLLMAGKLEGVARPTIGVLYPTKNGTSFLLDVGANTDCKPRHLLHFGVMGATFVRLFLNLERPRVALLNIGEESSKGNDAVVEAYKLFMKSSLNFTGNVEGGDIFEGTADVIVCDGFVGNILLKLFETYGTTFEKTFSKLISGNILYRFGAFLLQKPLTTYKETYNYERFGGIPLLGINGVALIGHGKSSPEAIKSAIFSALTMHERDIQGHIRKEIEQYKESI
jgi:glycerol-3-phosphate acyltransferase PlsX